jgi:hypothetical protein
MPNATLAPEDDDSPIDHTLGSSKQEPADDLNRISEAQRLRAQFNPHKVGFGLVPWPGTVPSIGATGSAKLLHQFGGRCAKEQE